MGVDLSKKRIIVIHGLAAKPPEDTWLDLSRRCLLENIRLLDGPLARELEADPAVVDSAYWADAIPHHIPDDAGYCRRLGERVDEVITERRKVKDRFHVGPDEKLAAFVKNRGIDLVKIFANALTIKDDVMRAMLVETRLYSNEQYVADQVRAPLERRLEEAWDAGCDVALLSHSMGTFVAYDVLWRYSHREAGRYQRYRDRRVDLFVTMGSPLCDNAVRDLLFSRFHKGGGPRQYPTNFRMWHNYACLGDVVSHGADFEEHYFFGLRKAGVVARAPEHLLIDYQNLHNPFRNVEHEGNSAEEKRNPHKEYGYYVQPRLGSWLVDFLKGALEFR